MSDLFKSDKVGIQLGNYETERMKFTIIGMMSVQVETLDMESSSKEPAGEAELKPEPEVKSEPGPEPEVKSEPGPEPEVKCEP